MTTFRRFQILATVAIAILGLSPTANAAVKRAPKLTSAVLTITQVNLGEVPPPPGSSVPSSKFATDWKVSVGQRGGGVAPLAA